MRLGTIIAALAMAATPAAARDLTVPADKGWQHAQTGMVVMPQVAGFQRTKLSDSTETEHDVTAQFGEDADGTFATFYLFHPAVPDVALWFDRAQVALDGGKTGRGASPATADPVAFAVGGGTPNALRQVYSIPGGALRSTAVALIPVGDWIVKLRMSSRTLTADRMDAKLMALVSGLRWPKTTEATGTPIALVRPCTAPLAYGKAKVVKPDGAAMLLSLMLPGIAAKEGKVEKGPPATWCREGEPLGDYGVYRANADANRYTIAMADAGRAIHVSPPAIAIGNGKPAISVTTEDVDGTIATYPSFSALPQPAQVWKLVTTSGPTGRMRGNDMTLSPDALKR
ncbi:hypothetical protein [Sphingomonas sp. Y38-1Y]|uniref:hypothetical protein n=1 Tax=Sphingomonas sp. Y38-1Y TaxID=3078265 RepID=UPI0028EE5466|nr:hypothetical protein [Sphingomonas sp. Y38-1Y]